MACQIARVLPVATAPDTEAAGSSGITFIALWVLRGLRLTPFASGSKLKAFVLCFFFLAVSSSKNMVIAYQALRAVVAQLTTVCLASIWISDDKNIYTFYADC